MGAPEGDQYGQVDEIPQHPVRITRPFWLGVYEVTQREYGLMMGGNLSASYLANADRNGVGQLDTRNFPADNVAWYRAAEFCNRLSKAEGLSAYYRLTTSEHEHASPRVDGGPGYRLPTEAEWEYACRAGTTTAFNFGETIEEGQANVNRQLPKSLRQSGDDPFAAPATIHRLSPESSWQSFAATVGSYSPNAFGLYDMHGNVAEWCNDRYDVEYYEDCPINDPQGPSAIEPASRTQQREFVVRGGSWNSSREAARSACRGHAPPGYCSSSVGFRIAKGDTPDWEAKLRNAAASDARVTLSGHTAAVRSLAFSPDGKMLASGSEDHTVRLWDVAAAKHIATLNDHFDHVISVTFSPDGKTLASGSQDTTIRLWDVVTGKNAATLRGHTYGVASVAYSPDGATLASGSWDKTIKLWDVGTEKERSVLDGHTWAVRYSPDGKVIASAGGDHIIRLWNASSGENIVNFKSVMGVIQSLAFSPDGKVLASATGEPMIRLWDVATGEICATLRQDFGEIHCVAYSPDGKTLASAAGDADVRHPYFPGDTTVRLWDLATGTDAIIFRGDSKGFWVVAFSPDGKSLAAGGMDGMIKLSPVTP